MTPREDKRRKGKVCVWKEVYTSAVDINFKTKCGQWSDGKDYYFKFCPYCGKEIKERRSHD